MGYVLPLVSAAFVAVLGLIGQFVISNRRYIPTIREERTKAYADFLSTYSHGMQIVRISQQWSKDHKSELSGIPKSDFVKFEDHLIDSGNEFDKQMALAHTYMLIVSPILFNQLGQACMLAMQNYQEGKGTSDAMNLAYTEFARKAHEDLESLRVQSMRLRSIFTMKIREINAS